MQVYEQYKPVQVAAGVTDQLFDSKKIGGFIAKTAGTVTIKDADGNVIVDAFPVTAGNTLPLPISLPTVTGLVSTAGGASGILCVH